MEFRVTAVRGDTAAAWNPLNYFGCSLISSRREGYAATHRSIGGSPSVVRLAVKFRWLTLHRVDFADLPRTGRIRPVNLS